MEETITVFDWNFIYGIGLGLVVGVVVTFGYFWFKIRRGNDEGRGIRGKTYHPKKQVKSHKKGELPDSDWPDASWDEPVTPSNHESATG